MAYEVFSIKLGELDKKLSQVHSRIRLSESADHEQISEEMKLLRQECMENEAALYNRLKYSKAGAVSRLADVYSEVKHIIETAREDFICSDSGYESGDAFEEKKILLAEYSLDFAVQAANRALLAAMESLEEQITQQERRNEEI